MLCLNAFYLQLRDTKARVVICTKDSYNAVHQAIPSLDGRIRKKIQLLCFGDVDGAEDIISKLESFDENMAPEPVSAKDVNVNICLILWNPENTSEYLTHSQLFLKVDWFWNDNRSNVVFWTWHFVVCQNNKKDTCTDQENFKDKLFLPLSALQGGRRYILKLAKRAIPWNAIDLSSEAREKWRNNLIEKDRDSDIYEYPESDVQYDAEDKDQSSLSENCDDYENDSAPRFSL